MNLTAVARSCLLAKTKGAPFERAQRCHPETRVVCAARNLGEPRDASHLMRRNNRASGSLPYELTSSQKSRTVSSTQNKRRAFYARLTGVFFFLTL
jgi:hypothetical protein